MENWFQYEIPPVPPIPEEELAMQVEAMMPIFDELEEIAAIPPFEAIPAFGEIPPFPEMAPFPDMFYSEDTFPSRNYTVRVKGDWGVKEFDVKLKEKFGDFYDKNSEEIQKMMREISEELAAKAEKDWKENALNEAHRHEEMAKAQLDRQMSEMNHQQRAMEVTHAQMEQLKREQEMRHLEMEKDMKVMEEKMKTFEKNLKEELVKDGYLGKNEKLETLNWTDDDVLTVNGKKIKEADQKKYREINEKFFNNRGHFSRPE
jgi:hypothetical protein